MIQNLLEMTVVNSDTALLLKASLVSIGNWCPKLAKVYSEAKRGSAAAASGFNNREENAVGKVS